MPAILNRVPYSEIELHWEQPALGSAEMLVRQLRGAIGQQLIDNPLFHQHDITGKTLYRYPLIQYRWHNGYGVIVGWKEAATLLPRLPWLDMQLQLGEQVLQVADLSFSTCKAEFGLAEQIQRYYFASPILLFNQDNYPRYKALNRPEKLSLCDRLLVAQLLTAMRGLGVEFDGFLYAGFSDLHTCRCHYKQQELVGIRGQFMCNALLPSGLAIGHGVSHGYGWIKPDYLGKASF